MSDVRQPWEFDYAPIPQGGGDSGAPDHDLVIATTDDIDPAQIAEQVSDLVPGVTITPLFSAHPIFWTRVEASFPIDRELLQRRLEEHGVTVRYIASAHRGSQQLPPPLDFSNAQSPRPSDWKTRPATSGDEPPTPWRWFLRERGIDVVRSYCGTGVGTRLAVIDNDGRDLDRVTLDAEVFVGVDSVPRSQSHAALMIGWAVATAGLGKAAFRGIAPDASPRLYCIPKPGRDVWALPLAIVRAVEDGADAIVCATYVEGQTSPLLDDALEFATRLGRGGRGTPVVMPTGREMSSAQGSTHSSLSLGLADPASDPRIFCIGPSARDGGWFLWRDRRGKWRPFANRGPAVRWLSPGDDLAHPFSPEERPWHAESSGASGIAAGAILLLIATNPKLSLEDIDSLLTQTATMLDPAHRAADPELGDRRDLEPTSKDRDGHNAKHGYGRLNAANACLAACDPFAQALLSMNERIAAEEFIALRRRGDLQPLYTPSLGLWAARAMLANRQVAQAVSCLMRGLRLYTRSPDRLACQEPGHLFRQLAVIVRLLLRLVAPQNVVLELRQLDAALRRILASGQVLEKELAWVDLLGQSLGWGREAVSSPHATGTPTTTVPRAAKVIPLGRA